MIYILFNDVGLPIGYTDRNPQTENYQSRWDWTSYEVVHGLAMRLTALTGINFVGTDAGPHVSPRYDVVRAPHVGDKVSYSFNGDTYPDGQIVKVTKGLTAVTSSGKRYRRYKQTGSWIMEGGTWSLVQGHISERNPHF